MVVLVWQAPELPNLQKLAYIVNGIYVHHPEFLNVPSKILKSASVTMYTTNDMLSVGLFCC